MAKTKQRTIATVEQDISDIQAAIRNLEQESERAGDAIAQNWRNPDDNAAMLAVMLERRKAGAMSELERLQAELKELKADQLHRDYYEQATRVRDARQVLQEANESLQAATIAKQEAERTAKSLHSALSQLESRLRGVGITDDVIALTRHRAYQGEPML